LREEFVAYGRVEDAVVIRDGETGRSRGFGFIEMADGAEAQAAVDALSGKEMGGRALTVNEARPQRTGGGGRGGDRDSR
jgi:RNA recognition motif-containing protein